MSYSERELYMMLLAAVLMPACEPTRGLRGAAAATEPIGSANAGPDASNNTMSDEMSAWLSADDFEISLRTGGSGFAPLPLQTTTIDAAGRVHVDRPLADLLVPARDARALYEMIIRSGFASMLDSYASREDGCESVFTDASSTIFGLARSGAYKQIVYYHGCAGDLPETQRLEELEGAVEALASIRALSEMTRPADCNVDGEDHTFEPAYSLGTSHGDTVGTLRFSYDLRGRLWIVQGCSGHEITRGSVLVRPDCSATLRVAADQPKRWPGTSRAYSELEVDSGGASSPTLKALIVHLNDKKVGDPGAMLQLAEEGSGCE